MATKKSKTPTEEKFGQQDLDIFEALAALDRKDYGWWDGLSPEQQRKFSPWMMAQWVSAVKSGGPTGAYYVLSTDINANKYLFNEQIMGHPQLQWLMLCAVSPGRGKQFHQWIPQLSDRIGSLKVAAKEDEVRTYFGKVYTGASEGDLDDITKLFVHEQNHKYRLAAMFPHMKVEDIDSLATVVTSTEIDEYENQAGN